MTGKHVLLENILNLADLTRLVAAQLSELYGDAAPDAATLMTESARHMDALAALVVDDPGEIAP